MLCSSLDGRGVWGRMDTRICMAESFCCPHETITTLSIGFAPTQNKKFKKKAFHYWTTTAFTFHYTHTHTHTHRANLRTCATAKLRILDMEIKTHSSVQSLSRVWLSAIPWAAARQASLSITNSQSLPKLMSIESVTPSNHLILCCPLLLPPSIFSNIRVFSKESVLRIRWWKYRSFGFSISPSNEYLGLISFRI